ncbi:MAG: PAS domain S-box protein, partial [Kiritimatiellaeota bacterium]|nr:PAS domain S-box protein [Kiritimatiellota bacterium]
MIRQAGEGIFLVRNLPNTPYAQSDTNVRSYALQTYMGKAVFCGGQAIGSLCAVFQKDFEPTEDDRKMLHIIAASIGMEEERRHAEQELRESEERYRCIVETLPDAIIIHRDGRYLYANPAALRLFGAATPEHLLGTPVMERIHPDFRERILQRILAVGAGTATPLLE